MGGMVGAVVHMLVALLAQHLEDGEIGVARHQGQHRRAGRLQHVPEAFVMGVLQRPVHLAQAIGPQTRQFGRRCHGHTLGRAEQLFDVDQRTALEERLHLPAALHTLAARQQQGLVMVADVEGQWRTQLDALLDEGQR